MANFQLRQFHFFKRESLQDLPDAFGRPELLMASGGGDLIFLADSTGSIHIINRSFIVKSFVASSETSSTRITQMLHIHQARTLLTIEENVTTSAGKPAVKLWPVDKLLRQSEVQPVTVKYQLPTNTPYPLTAVTATPTINQIALGFAGGHIVLIRGNIPKSKSTKQRTLHKAPEPVTNLHLVTDDSGNSVTLFATTTAQTLAFDTSAASDKSQVSVLEERGCGIGCSQVNEDKELIVARDEAIYFYNIDGRGPCFAFEAPKVLLRRFKHYLLLATAAPSSMVATTALGTNAVDIDSSSNSSSLLLQHDTESRVYSFNDATTFTILDTKNKLVAYTGVVAGGVRGVATEWGSVFVLGGHGTLDYFSEKELLEKLDILYRQNLYPLAVKMAQNGNYDLASVAGIYKRYGDWLYSKDDFDSAMSQYVQTIGYVEPSYIIRKYLDAQRLVNLASYLQELHSAGMATSDHTTLLLNCYTKLRDEERLNQFIHTQEDYQFDVDTAIHVCRQAGFYEQALYLADKFFKTEMYLKLKVEDQNDIRSALAYMRKLDDADVSTYMSEFGRRCLASLPQETTELLVEVCIRGMDARLKTAQQAANVSGSVTGANGVNLENDRPDQRLNLGSDDLDLRALSVSMPAVSTNILSLRRIQHLFADQPAWLAAFLERVIASRWQNAAAAATATADSLSSDTNGLIQDEENDMKSAWNTLLELYLCGVESPLHELAPSSANKQTPKERALELLRSPHANIDWDRAYILCASNNFTEGIAALYEQRGDIAALLELYIENDDVQNIRKLLSVHGERQPELYIKALHYFARNPQNADNQQSLTECLKTIERFNIMSPLRVLQALGSSEKSGVTLGMVRSYIMRQIEATAARVKDNERVIDSYTKEHALHHEQMEDLKTKPVVFQSTKCTSCMAPLDLPSIHFLCKHSYHQRCLGDVADICPKCQVENQMLEDQRRRQEIGARRHDLFFDRLNKADNGFDVIAEWFSKSPFAFTKLVDQ